MDELHSDEIAKKALEEHVAACQAKGLCYDAYFLKEKLGLTLVLGKRSGAAGDDMLWCPIRVVDVNPPSTLVLPTDELVAVNERIIAIRDGVHVSDRKKIERFASLKRKLATSSRPLRLTFIKSPFREVVSSEAANCRIMATNDKNRSLLVSSGDALRDEADAVVDVVHKASTCLMHKKVNMHRSRIREIARRARSRAICARFARSITCDPLFAIREADSVDAYVTACRALVDNEVRRHHFIDDGTTNAVRTAAAALSFAECAAKHSLHHALAIRALSVAWDATRSAQDALQKASAMHQKILPLIYTPPLRTVTPPSAAEQRKAAIAQARLRVLQQKRAAQAHERLRASDRRVHKAERAAVGGRAKPFSNKLNNSL